MTIQHLLSKLSGLAKGYIPDHIIGYDAEQRKYRRYPSTRYYALETDADDPEAVEDKTTIPLTVSGTPTGGTYDLLINDMSITGITYNSSNLATLVQAAMPSGWYAVVANAPGMTPTLSIWQTADGSEAPVAIAVSIAAQALTGGTTPSVAVGTIEHEARHYGYGDAAYGSWLTWQQQVYILLPYPMTTIGSTEIYRPMWTQYTI